MDLKWRESKIFNEVPTYFLDKVLYVCDVGDIEYLDYLFKEKNLNVNRRFKDEWCLPGYDEAMNYIQNEEIKLSKQRKNQEIDMQEFMISLFKIRRERDSLYKKYTGSCNYGSLLDAMIRYAIEAERWYIVDYLLNIEGAVYSKCFQTFLVALEYNIPSVVETLLDSKIELHTYTGPYGYVGDRILNNLKFDSTVNDDLKEKVYNYVINNFDIKKYKKDKKKQKKQSLNI